VALLYTSISYICESVVFMEQCEHNACSVKTTTHLDLSWQVSAVDRTSHCH